MSAKRKARVRQRANQKNSKPKPSRKGAARKTGERPRSKMATRHIYELGLTRPAAMVESMPKTVYDELCLRATVARWEHDWRKRTPTSRRIAMNLLDTNGTFSAQVGKDVVIDMPFVTLAGCASGARQFGDDRVSILLTCVYGLKDGKWCFVDDHLWLDTAKLVGADEKTRIRMFDDVIVHANVNSYRHKGRDRLGVGYWTVASSNLPYQMSNRGSFRTCPPIAGSTLDILGFEREGEDLVISVMHENTANCLYELLARDNSAVHELACAISKNTFGPRRAR